MSPRSERTPSPRAGAGAGAEPDAPRLAFVMDHPAQHFSPGLREAAARGHLRPVALYWNDFRGGYEDKGFNRTVTWDVDLLEGYESVATDPSASTRRRVATIVRWLRRSRPDVLVVAGWSAPIARAALVWGALTRTPTYLYSDASWQHASGGSTRGWSTKLLLRVLFRRFAAISTGTFNREFYVVHGMHPAKIVNGLIPIDVDHFAAARRDTSPTGDRPVIIGFAGKLIEQKGVEELLRAVALLRDRDDWQLRIVGDGVLRDDLALLAKDLEIEDRVDFVGFVNQQEIPATLASFDIFVAPSTWDLRILAVAEAMAAGVPVVVSDATGIWGPGDLVEDTTTGRVYRQGHADDLAAVLRDLVDHPEERQRLRDAAIERVAGHGPDAFARCLEQAAARALSSH